MLHTYQGVNNCQDFEYQKQSVLHNLPKPSHSVLFLSHDTQYSSNPLTVDTGETSFQAVLIHCPSNVLLDFDMFLADDEYFLKKHLFPRHEVQSISVNHFSQCECRTCVYFSTLSFAATHNAPIFRQCDLDVRASRSTWQNCISIKFSFNVTYFMASHQKIVIV